MIVAKISPLSVIPLYPNTTFMRNNEFRITRINTNKKYFENSTNNRFFFNKQTN